MNKTKMMLTATAGAMALVVLVMAFFTWDAFSSRTAALEGDEAEGTEGLNGVMMRAQTLSRKSVYPCAASLKAIESNTVAVAEWRKEAGKLCSRGDRTYEKTTPAALKETLRKDAERLAHLPGAAGGRLVKEDFDFGPFKDYISGGKLPSEAEAPELQRRWDDVATVVEMLAQSGIAELTGVQFAKAEPTVVQLKDKQRKKPAPRRPSRKAEAEPKQGDAVVHTYVISFAAKPAAFVRAMNAFVTCERFVTVEDFSFSRAKDAVAEALGAEDRQTKTTASGTSRRRRRPLAESREEENKPKSNVVTDPQLDAPVNFSLTVSVRDCRSLEEDKNGEEKK